VQSAGAGPPMSLLHAFYVGWAKAQLILVALWGALTLFHESTVGFAAAIIAAGGVTELLPTLDPRSNVTLLGSELLGAAVALALTVSYLHLNWWVLAVGMAVAIAVRVWQARSVRSAAR